MKVLLDKIINGSDLSVEESFNIMNDLMSGKLDDIQISALLIALRCKGESVSEILGFAKSMRQKMMKMPLQKDALDICGTGGDSLGTFNISTATCFVISGAGVPVAKHGNRSMTSKSGSADVLQSLGVNINKTVEESRNDIDKFGLGFMFAPQYHPAMKYAVNARSTLGIRTIFNLLGPLCNPAKVKYQAMGIFNSNFLEKQIKVLFELGLKSAMVFHGEDGLDEITTTTNTKVFQFINRGEINCYEINPNELEMPLSNLSDLKGGSPKENAQIILRILKNEKGPKRDIVILNAAAGIFISGKSKSLKEGISLAKKSLDSGSAYEALLKIK
ncbi:MAG: anthranilate phosphoribosyltransferase [bacterium TMED250]|nr:MAG: anthranilate phosphoribosyltransferase [bacterium TMED250]|tara:strand:+ start:2193 stop:3185 length:993 start_codon:yes stop_codon:yes gene_type:complete